MTEIILGTIGIWILVVVLYLALYSKSGFLRIRKPIITDTRDPDPECEDCNGTGIWTVETNNGDIGEISCSCTRIKQIF